VRTARQFATGLDTGACYGRELSALLLPSKEIIQVPSDFNCLSA
jgi:hypothetical protein